MKSAESPNSESARVLAPFGRDIGEACVIAFVVACAHAEGIPFVLEGAVFWMLSKANPKTYPSLFRSKTAEAFLELHWVGDQNNIPGHSFVYFFRVFHNLRRFERFRFFAWMCLCAFFAGAVRLLAGVVRPFAGVLP